MVKGQELCPRCGHVVHWPQLNDAQWLRERYERASGTEEIAKELGCDRMTVLTAMKRHGLSRRPARRPWPSAQLQAIGPTGA